MLFELPDKCYRVAAKALIRDDQGRILLVRERGETWDLPGGGIEHVDNSAVDALRREINEELGVAIVELDDRPLFIWKLIHGKSGNAILMQIGYTVKLASHDFKPNPDINELRFVAADEIGGLDFDAPNMTELLIGLFKDTDN